MACPVSVHHTVHELRFKYKQYLFCFFSVTVYHIGFIEQMKEKEEEKKRNTILDLKKLWAPEEKRKLVTVAKGSGDVQG